MNFMENTNQYYSLWLGEAGILSRPFSGIRWVYSPERNQIQVGYSQQFDLYILCQPERVVVSYGESISGAVDEIDKIKSRKRSRTSCFLCGFTCAVHYICMA